MSIHFPSTAVVDSNENEPPSSPKPTPDSRNNRGLILGMCLGVFSWYVSAVSNIAVHFYWFFQSLHQVMCISHVQCLIVSSTVAWICIAVFRSLHTPLHQFNIPLFTLSPPLSLFLPLSSSSSSTSSPAGLSGTNVLLYSFGFIFSVVVFPIGLVLWMLSCCGVFSEESDDSSHTSYSSPHNNTSECM